MLSKEDIEKAKQSFKEETDNEIKVYSLVNDYTQNKTDNHKIILEYIEELETKEQKLIEKLEKDIKNDFTIREHIVSNGVTLGTRTTHVDIYATEILSILKGEK